MNRVVWLGSIALHGSSIERPNLFSGGLRDFVVPLRPIRQREVGGLVTVQEIERREVRDMSFGRPRFGRLCREEAGWAREGVSSFTHVSAH